LSERRKRGLCRGGGTAKKFRNKTFTRLGGRKIRALGKENSERAKEKTYKFGREKGLSGADEKHPENDGEAEKGGKFGQRITNKGNDGEKSRPKKKKRGGCRSKNGDLRDARGRPSAGGRNTDCGGIGKRARKNVGGVTRGEGTGAIWPGGGKSGGGNALIDGGGMKRGCTREKAQGELL